MRTIRIVSTTLLGLGLLSGTGAARGADVADPIDALQDAGKLIFKIADLNNDGLISQKEAIDAGNLVVGGFFFRADTNGDGTLSREELQQAQQAVLAQNPILRVLVEKNRGVQPAATAPGTPAGNAALTFQSLLDANRDGNVSATEVRNLVTTTVTALYATADTDRDSQMSPTEVNAALVGIANAAATAAFQAADTDRNGQISQAEYDQAIVEPARAVFRAVDANNDGQISQQEAQSARQAVMNQVRMLRLPDAPNSPRSMIRSGNAPAPGTAAPGTNPAVRP